ncbi:hypothetical protein CBOS2020_30720 [Clostridium botulinum]|nr:hypothetical protein CBOS2020_30720 [Clostridium botulinum]
MINNISCYIVDYLIRRKIIDIDNKIIYVFGFAIVYVMCIESIMLILGKVINMKFNSIVEAK